MQTVTVNASTRYEVLIEKGLLSRTGELTANVFDPSRSTAAIITDDTVAGLYLRPVVESAQGRWLSASARWTSPTGRTPNPTRCCCKYMIF